MQWPHSRGHRTWKNVDNFDLLSLRPLESAGLDQCLLSHLFLVRLEIPGSSLWGKEQPKHRDCHAGGGVGGGFGAPSALSGVPVGSWLWVGESPRARNSRSFTSCISESGSLAEFV